MPQAYLESCRISKMEHFRAFSEYANECGEDDLNRNLQRRTRKYFCILSYLSLSLSNWAAMMWEWKYFFWWIFGVLSLFSIKVTWFCFLLELLSFRMTKKFFDMRMSIRLRQDVSDITHILIYLSPNTNKEKQEKNSLFSFFDIPQWISSQKRNINEVH